MRRHSFIARLGPADTASISLSQKSSVVTEIRFVDGQKRLGFGLGYLIDQLLRRDVCPSDAAADLAVLAAVVTAADTRLSRATESQDSWTREIDLYLPVSDPALWAGATELVQRMLGFLTGDRWRIFIRPRNKENKQLFTRPNDLALSAAFDCVCLFSGGLDSFVGAIDLLAAKRKPLLISHYWDVSTSSQKLCASRLASIYGDMEPRHLRARVGFTKNDFAKVANSEPTQRGRSFLFFALAAVAASGIGAGTTIFVPENGLISLNVPLDPLRVGAWSTRTTHPFYMARWNELLAHLGIGAVLENPYRFQTKGEMLAGCANQALLKRFVGETISCSSVSKARYLKQSPRHCGFCVPCLIRRASIETALGTDPTIYSLPGLTSRIIDAKKAEGEHIRSFQLMAGRLARKPGLAPLLIRKPGPLSDYSDTEIAKYAAVFHRGIAEVDALVNAARVRPQ